MRRSPRNPRPSRAARRLGTATLLGALALSGVAATQTFAIDPGTTIRPGPQTPADATAALNSAKTVVIAFVVPGAADDDEVAASIARLRANSTASKNVTYLVYKVTSKKPTFGDLPKLLQIQGTPTVSVITPDDRLQNQWTGLVDDVLIGQSIATARESGSRGADGSTGTPKKAVKPKKLSKKEKAAHLKGLALAKKVDAAFKNLPGATYSLTGTADGSAIAMTGTGALRSGKDSGSTTRIEAKGRTIELITTAGGKEYGRLVGAPCWKPSPKNSNGSSSPSSDPLASKHSTFTAPTRVGKTLKMRQTERKDGVVSVSELLIDARTYLPISSKVIQDDSLSPGSIMTFTPLNSRPKIPSPTPLC